MSEAAKTSLEQDLMPVKVMVQPTPNPNALKFITNRELKAEGKVTFNSKEEAKDVPLVQKLFDVEEVLQIYLFENIVTVTFEPTADLIKCEDAIIASLKENLNEHDPKFSVEGDESERRAKLPPELREIESILDKTIRPALQGDGGDLDVVSLIDNELTVRYQGACGTCPSSTMGTLMAIEGILKEQFDPDITVTPI